MEELLGVIVGKDDPEVRLERPQPGADLGRDRPDMLDNGLVLGLRHREELRRMRQHRTADHGRHHYCFSLLGAKLSLKQRNNKLARDGPALRRSCPAQATRRRGTQ
jgi:hypothetical protein